MTQETRRRFLKTNAFAFCYLVGAGKYRLLTPAEAKVATAPLQVLTGLETDTLEAMAEAVAPGSREAGIAHYLDYQLAALPEESLLMAKYLGIEPPLTPFYQAGLGAAHQAAIQLFKRAWSELTKAESKVLIDKIAKGEIDPWLAAPSPFFFFVLRADACDVLYGTESGSENIGIPYMAHIDPSNNWRAKSGK